jgi:bacteriocin biosynthesis cyclodehydratase domain-containing protein
MQQIYVATIGAFGRHIAQVLSTTGRAVSVPVEGDGQLAALPEASAYVLAAGRQAADTECAMDRLARQRRRIFLPAIVEHPELRIGPLYVPDSAAACAGCYHRRHRQHAASTEPIDALAAHYLADPAGGAQGYLPAAATFAALVVRRLVDEALTGNASGTGMAFRAHLLTPQLRKDRVIGVHCCPNCGSGRDERTRSVARLTAAPAGLTAGGRRIA